MSLSISLRQYADSLAPSQNFLEKAGEAIKTIQDVLHRHLGSQFSIDRIQPLGSLTKKTSLYFKMDIDVVIFLNDERPPFDDFLTILHDFITRNIDTACKRTPLSLCLKMNDLEMDLVPARNFLYTKGYSGNDDQVIVQVANTLEYLKDNFDPQNKLEFSSSLSEGAVAFEREHSAFSHSLSRLAKFWSKTIGIPGFKSPRSSIMEYLGAWAADEEERRDSQDILHGFRRFLAMIQQPHNLNIVWTKYYRKTDIPMHIQGNRPLLLDPTNPYNNFLEDSHIVDKLMQMSEFATVTLSRLNKAEETFNPAKIFEPQPTFSDILRSPKFKSPKNFLVGRQQKTFLQPKIEKRSGSEKIDSSIAETHLFSFTDAVVATVKTDMGHGEGVDTSDRVESKLREFISPGSTWSSASNERHEDRQTTFIIPIGKDATEIIKISCDWT